MKKKMGIKFDDEKIEWDLLPIEPVEEIIKILQYGMKKYSRDNWKHVKPFKRRYYNALMRHMTAWQKGKKYDEETKVYTLAHAGCCLLFLLWGDIQEDKRSYK